MPASKYELRNGSGTRFVFPEVSVDDTRNNISGVGGNGGGSTTTITRTLPGSTGYIPCAPCIPEDGSSQLAACEAAVNELLKEYNELVGEYNGAVEENEALIDEIAGLEDSLTASGGCTSFGYGIYQHNMMNGNVCISTYTNSLGQKRLKMDWMSTGNQVTASPGGSTGFVKLFCNVWSDTAKIGQVSWGNNDNILMPYRYSNPMKGPVTLSESRNSNNYPIGGSATHIRLTPITDSAYIAGIIRISDIPEFFSLTYSAGTGGSVEGELSQNVLKAEDGTAVTATSDAGYTFTGWSDGSTANPRTDTNVTSYVNVTANFAPIEN